LVGVNIVGDACVEVRAEQRHLDCGGRDRIVESTF
jgi:hypothetical protein